MLSWKQQIKRLSIGKLNEPGIKKNGEVKKILNLAMHELMIE